ncbi:hypothetical protein IPA_07170 [Ignicoccus pacificus DSM 13166]|uniref:PurM-like N-terminal domain-containing protein n=1 Tax=Ignicoccus pacificus DSM 13166 TaxID=940294 RepID=A0A977PLT3_9CREN|nr:hypothetical protein IPA_07170 [Ignicoccus pacificus DSM 13166]
MGRVEEELVKLAKSMKLRTGALGLGDDCECLKLTNSFLCANVDGFRAKDVKMEFMDLRDVGWRGVIASLSDLVAKGARPLASSFSVYSNSIEGIKELSEGALEAIREYDLIFMGADSNKGEDAIDVFSIGTAKKPIPIGGAKVGDSLVIPRGCWGCVSTCLRGEAEGEILEHCKRPRIRIELVDVIEEFADFIHASSDSSDSLAITLWRIASSSKVRIDLFDVPKPEEVSLEDALFSGEEYLPVFIIENDVAEEFAKRIGGIVAGKVSEGEGVYFRGRLLEPRGWEWF